jgi:hypothetical protein
MTDFGLAPKILESGLNLTVLRFPASTGQLPSYPAQYSSLAPSATRYKSSSCAIMSNEPARETDSLLGAAQERDPSPQQTGSNVEGSVWLNYSSYAYGLAKSALEMNKINVLLVFVPLGIAAWTFGWHTITISVFNLLAIIPLSALVSNSADELSNVVGDLLGGLINATFGNAVELIVCRP